MQYIGIPYKDRGRSVDGVDCYGLVKLFMQNEFAVTLDDFDYCGDNSGLIKEHKEDVEWHDVPKGEYRRGDVMILRQMGVAGHVGRFAAVRFGGRGGGRDCGTGRARGGFG